MSNDVRTRGSFAGLISAMRPRQWVKNLLVVVAPAAAGILGHHGVLARTAVAFVAFCLTASGVYLLNDVRDIDLDRRHPKKRHRAIAAGHVSPTTAVVVSIVLLLGGLACAIALRNLALGVELGLYVVNSLAYVFVLKTMPVIEMASVAAGFFLRALAGASVNHIPVSSWFLVVISFGALFLVIGKRFSERQRLGDDLAGHRAVLAQYPNEFLSAALVLSATVVVTTYCLWAFDTSSSGLSNIRHNVSAIRLTVVPVVLVMLHILRLLMSGRGEAPEELVLKDRTVQVLGLTWGILLLVGIY